MTASTNSSLETVSVTQSASVATITLQRPEVHNAFNAAVIRELTTLFRDLADNDGVHVIVLRGEGRSFCAGADVNWMRESLELTEEQNVLDAERMSDMFAAMNDAPQALIGRVHGAALGGGMGLIAVCDTVVAARDTRFGFTETRLGIIPAVISRFVVPKIGVSWARRYFLSGERFDGSTARDIGLVHELVDPEELDAAVDAVVKELLAAGPQAIREAKALVKGLMKTPAEKWREFTAAQIARVRTSPEGQEGLRAFLEKREPAWRTPTE